MKLFNLVLFNFPSYSIIWPSHFRISIHVTTEKCDAKVMLVLVGIIEIEISISVMSVLDSEIQKYSLVILKNM